MQVIINVGLLHTSGTGAIAASQAMAAIRRAMLPRATISAVSDSEETLIIYGDTIGPLESFKRHLDAASVGLAQDCIAAYFPELEAGALVGPDADKWGKFNPDYFFIAPGKRLELSMRTGK